MGSLGPGVPSAPAPAAQTQRSQGSRILSPVFFHPVHSSICSNTSLHLPTDPSSFPSLHTAPSMGRHIREPLGCRDEQIRPAQRASYKHWLPVVVPAAGWHPADCGLSLSQLFSLGPSPASCRHVRGCRLSSVQLPQGKELGRPLHLLQKDTRASRASPPPGTPGLPAVSPLTSETWHLGLTVLAGQLRGP